MRTSLYIIGISMAVLGLGVSPALALTIAGSAAAESVPVDSYVFAAGPDHAAATPNASIADSAKPAAQPALAASADTAALGNGQKPCDILYYVSGGRAPIVSGMLSSATAAEGAASMTSPVPEPATALLVLLGLAGTGVVVGTSARKRA